MYGYVYGVLGLMAFYLKTQMGYVMKNVTTIEELEKKRNPENHGLRNVTIACTALQDLIIFNEV